MITARGANAARRHGGDAAAGRPGAPRRGRPGLRTVTGFCSVAAVSASVALAAAGCASSPVPQTGPRLLPGNQDTAAAVNLPATPAAGRVPGAAPALAMPTTVTASATYTTLSGAEQGMALTLIAQSPVVDMTPQNSEGLATSRPPLEVITMPMWLWVDSPAAMATVVQDPALGATLVVDRIVVDQVQWYLDGSTTPWQTCGDTTQPAAPSPTTPDPPNAGPGAAYSSSMDPANSGDPVQLACVHPGFTAPYYQPTTVNGQPSTADGVHTLHATVQWHVDFWLYDPTTGYPEPIGGRGQAHTIVTAPLSNTLSFRVGEIQALVTKP